MLRASETSGGRAEDDLSRGEAGVLRLRLAGLEVIELAAVPLSSCLPNSSSISLATLFWKSFYNLLLYKGIQPDTSQNKETYDSIDFHFKASNMHIRPKYLAFINDTCLQFETQ